MAVMTRISHTQSSNQEKHTVYDENEEVTVLAICRSVLRLRSVEVDFHLKSLKVRAPLGRYLESD